MSSPHLAATLTAPLALVKPRIRRASYQRDLFELIAF
jgi:hypothetical protein